MRKSKRFWLILTGSVVGGLGVLVLAALLVAQSSWFGNFVRQKVISTIEDSTGGRVEIGSFQFNPWNLDVKIRNLVLHGTEPAAERPLARIALLELRLKLLSGFKKVVDLAYLGVTEPQVNLIVNPDGTTNVPSPKVKSPPSQTSGLETVVNLAIGEFRVTNGWLLISQRASKFSAHGQDLHALLSYNTFNRNYEGTLAINPLLLALGNNPPLPVQVNMPVLIEKDAVSISGATLSTAASEIRLNAGLRDLNSPVVTARVTAHIALPEMQKSLDLPIDTAAHDVPQDANLDLQAQYDDKSSSVSVQAAHLVMGQTNFEAAGTLEPVGNQAVQFNGKLALGQLSRLAKLGTTKVGGNLNLHGHATLDAQKNYAVNGTVDSQGLSVTSGTTSLSDIRFATPFHADPYLISLDGLKLSMLGGNLNAKIFIEKMQQLSVDGHISNFSIPVLARAFAGHPLGYDGIVSGELTARSNLKAKGASGLTAQTHLVITPGNNGVPMDGRIDGRYNGATGVVDLEKSYVALPHSRVDLAGDINRQLNVDLVSHNLNDFLPAANFGAAQPTTSLPVSLQGGTVSVHGEIRGNLSAPQIQAQAAVDKFAVQGSPVQHLGLDLAATQSGAAVTNGVLNSLGLHSTFDASIGLRHWKPLPLSPVSANLSVPGGKLASLLALAGQKDIPASGTVNAQVHVRGTYGDPLGNASFQLQNGVIYSQPFDKVQANVDLAHELISLTSLEVDAAGGQLTANGTFHHPSDSFQIGHADFHVRSNSIQLANIQALQQRNPGTAGSIKLSADGSGNLSQTRAGSDFQLSNIDADLSASGLKANNQAAGDLYLQANTVNGSVVYNVHSNFAGSAIQVNGTTSLAKGYLTKAAASIQNLSVQKSLAIAGQPGIPATGTLSANAKISGMLSDPNAQVDLKLSKAVLYTEPINEFATRLSYSNTQIDIPSLDLNIPAGTLSASGQYVHPSGDLESGHMQFHLNSSDMDLAKIRHLAAEDMGVAGDLKLMADVAGDVRSHGGKPELLLSKVNANISAEGLQANHKDLGQLHLVTDTQQQVVRFNLDSSLAQASLRASGQTQLTGNYNTNANFTFGNIRYSNIALFLPSYSGTPPPFDALVEGQANVNGPLLNLDALKGRAELTQMVVKTSSRNSPVGTPAARTVELQNQGPAIFTLNRSVVHVQQFKIQGRDTYLEAGGDISLSNPNKALGLTLQGNADLGILQNADRDIYSSGSVLLDATVHGSFSKPLVNGRLVLKNANFNDTDFSNGLQNGNGVILLNGTTATIQNLTGESGGGKISVAGFAGFTPTADVFNLHASAKKVRTRYSGISITSDADIAVAGSSLHSTVSGTVTIDRIAYSSSSGDAGSILASASVPPSTLSAPSLLLSGMRLDVRIVTAPDLRVVTTYAQKISISSNVTLRGTAQDPGMLGHLTVTNGELVFFGNTYTVNVGSVNFYNPTAIQPVLDLSLETIAQGVDVTLGVRGPMSDLKLSYRSDPPLTFEQIVQLLATNTTPSNPQIAANQPTPPQQSLGQLGESAVLGQAVANPLASRVQRVFGLTQFKIDPSIAGSNGQPSARVTLQQKITSNLTFTYITDVTQTNSEIIRVTYDLTPKLSAVALRNYNGNVSIEFFYKFQKR
jgi:translocation and assembly module TamB